MNLQVEISDEKIANMTPSAKDELAKQLKEYADNIIKESNLIAEGNLVSGANIEITSNSVLQAVKKYISSPPKKKRVGLVLLKIGAPISMWFPGFLFDANGYGDNIVKLIVFVISLIVATMLTVLLVLKED